MSEIPHIPHPLKRDGKSQAQRVIDALSPDYAKVDERTQADLLHFIFKYARQVRYYDTQLNPSDWTAFFQRSLPFVIANISKTDTNSILEDFNELAEEAGRFENFEGVHLLLSHVIDVFRQIHLWNRELYEDQSGMGAMLRDLIRTNLSFAARRLIAWSNIHGEEVKTLRQELGMDWGLSETDWNNKKSLYADIRGSYTTKVRHAVKELDALFQVFWAGMNAVVSQAKHFLPKSLSVTDAHTPHLGLLFTFLELFEKTRNNPKDPTGSSLNAASQKHLDYFYEKVLGLTLNEVVADKAYLVFEPAKNLPPAKLVKGAVFKAGKDSKEVPIHFGLDDEIVVTQTQVTDIRTMYLQQDYSDPTAHPKVKKVRIAPIANSADGMGEAFPKESLPSWKTLGWDISKMPVGENSELGFSPYPDARLALVLSSKVLHLQGGKRTITLTFTCGLPATGFGELIAGFDPDSSQLQDVLTKRYFEIGEKDFDALDLSSSAREVLAEMAFPIRFPDPGEFAQTIGKALRNKYGPTYPYDSTADQAVLAAQYKPAFNASFSGADGWIEAFVSEINISGAGNNYLFKMILDLEESAAPVTWYNPEVHGDILDTYLPSLKLELVHGDFVKEYEPSLYHFLRYSKIADLNCSVAVCDFRNITIQTDSGVQEAGKPFMPFGPAPKLGNRFYLGSEEVFRKKLSRFRVKASWKDKPDSFEKHYDNYQKDGLDATKINVEVKARVENTWKDLDHKNLFEKDPFSAVSAQISAWLFDEGISTSFNEIKDQLGASPDFSRDGYIRFALEGSTFLHEMFGQVFARQATAQAMLANKTPQLVGGAIYKDFTNPKNPEYIEYVPGGSPAPDPKKYSVELPRNPYTPVIEDISVDYEAFAGKADIRIYHLYPYEGCFKRETWEAKPPLLPLFEEEGALFIGLKDLKPGEDLNLLFKVAESTANPDAEPAAVSWFYLKSNEWKLLGKDTGVQSDETTGFLRSGVVKFALPSDIDQNNTLLPPTLHWLKACAPQRADAVCETVAIHSQAARVSFMPEKESDTSRLAKPLPAGLIAKAQTEVAAIKKISQPYPSFGGLPKEEKDSFYRRSSERLRHKGRAITLFDYERIVLQAFPEIYKTKCIPHTLGLPTEQSDFQLAPGHVLLAVIPDLKHLKFADRFEPKATRGLLDKVEEHLRQRVSPFVQIRALNPHYERFWISCNIRFIPGKSTLFYQQKLHDDLQRFLAPWAFDEGQEIDFGGVVYKAVILRMVESLDYVDYLTDFRLKFEVLEGNNRLRIEEADEITPRTARSILVAGAHELRVIEDLCCKPEGNTPVPGGKGLGYEAIGKMAIPDLPLPETAPPCIEEETNNLLS